MNTSIAQSDDPGSQDEYAARSAFDSHGLRSQPAIPVASAKLAVWIFLTSEAMFFVALIGACVALRLGAVQGDWPSPEEVGVVTWIGALNTIVMICASITMVFAVSSSGRGDAGLAKSCVAASFLLGIVFLGIRAGEYQAKFDQGIYPRGPIILLYNRPDLNYLAGVKASTDAQILELEKAKTRAASQRAESPPVNTDGSHQQGVLERLILIRSGLVRWTSQTAGQSPDPALRKMAVMSLAHLIAPRGENLAVESYLADELVEVRERIIQLRSEKSEFDDRIVELQSRIKALAGTLRSPSKDDDANLSRTTVRKMLEETTAESAEAAANSSRLADLIVPLQARIDALTAFADVRGGINENFHMKLPRVIPNGTAWASTYFLLTGLHAFHVFAGLVALGLLLTMRLDVTRSGLMENVSLYWHFVGAVWILLFLLLYLF